MTYLYAYMYAQIFTLYNLFNVHKPYIDILDIDPVMATASAQGQIRA